MADEPESPPQVPFRLRILKTLTAMLESVEIALPTNTEDGANTVNLVGRVFRGREQFGDSDPLPMLSILEPPAAIEPNESQPDNPTNAVQWDILVQGWVIDDKVNPCDPAYFLAALVCKKLAEHKKQGEGKRGDRGKDYFGEGLRVEKITIGSPVVRPGEFASPNACFYLLITLKIVEDMLNPLG